MNEKFEIWSNYNNFFYNRLHKIKNYHFYCVYKLADSDISSTETESSTEESESSTEQSDSDDEVTTDESESS